MELRLETTGSSGVPLQEEMKVRCSEAIGRRRGRQAGEQQEFAQQNINTAGTR